MSACTINPHCYKLQCVMKNCPSTICSPSYNKGTASVEHLRERDSMVPLLCQDEAKWNPFTFKLPQTLLTFTVNGKKSLNAFQFMTQNFPLPISYPVFARAADKPVSLALWCWKMLLNFLNVLSVKCVIFKDEKANWGQVAESELTLNLCSTYMSSEFFISGQAVKYLQCWKCYL